MQPANRDRYPDWGPGRERDDRETLQRRSLSSEKDEPQQKRRRADSEEGEIRDSPAASPDRIDRGRGESNWSGEPGWNRRPRSGGQGAGRSMGRGVPSDSSRNMGRRGSHYLGREVPGWGLGDMPEVVLGENMWGGDRGRRAAYDRGGRAGDGGHTPGSDGGRGFQDRDRWYGSGPDNYVPGPGTPGGWSDRGRPVDRDYDPCETHRDRERDRGYWDDGGGDWKRGVGGRRDHGWDVEAGLEGTGRPVRENSRDWEQRSRGRTSRGDRDRGVGGGGGGGIGRDESYGGRDEFGRDRDVPRDSPTLGHDELDEFGRSVSIGNGGVDERGGGAGGERVGEGGWDGDRDRRGDRWVGGERAASSVTTPDRRLSGSGQRWETGSAHNSDRERERGGNYEHSRIRTFGFGESFVGMGGRSGAERGLRGWGSEERERSGGRRTPVGVGLISPGGSGSGSASMRRERHTPTSSPDSRRSESSGRDRDLREREKRERERGCEWGRESERERDRERGDPPPSFGWKHMPGSQARLTALPPSISRSSCSSSSYSSSSGPPINSRPDSAVLLSWERGNIRDRLKEKVKEMEKAMSRKKEEENEKVKVTGNRLSDGVEVETGAEVEETDREEFKGVSGVDNTGGEGGIRNSWMTAAQSTAASVSTGAAPRAAPSVPPVPAALEASEISRSDKQQHSVSMAVDSTSASSTVTVTNQPTHPTTSVATSCIATSANSGTTNGDVDINQTKRSRLGWGMGLAVRSPGRPGAVGAQSPACPSPLSGGSSSTVPVGGSLTPGSTTPGGTDKRVRRRWGGGLIQKVTKSATGSGLSKEEGDGVEVEGASADAAVGKDGAGTGAVAGTGTDTRDSTERVCSLPRMNVPSVYPSASSTEGRWGGGGGEGGGGANPNPELVMGGEQKKDVRDRSRQGSEEESQPGKTSTAATTVGSNSAAIAGSHGGGCSYSSGVTESLEEGTSVCNLSLGSPFTPQLRSRSSSDFTVTHNVTTATEGGVERVRSASAPDSNIIGSLTTYASASTALATVGSATSGTPHVRNFAAETIASEHKSDAERRVVEVEPLPQKETILAGIEKLDLSIAEKEQEIELAKRAFQQMKGYEQRQAKREARLAEIRQQLKHNVAKAAAAKAVVRERAKRDNGYSIISTSGGGGYEPPSKIVTKVEAVVVPSPSGATLVVDTASGGDASSTGTALSTGSGAGTATAATSDMRGNCGLAFCDRRMVELTTRILKKNQQRAYDARRDQGLSPVVSRPLYTSPQTTPDWDANHARHERLRGPLTVLLARRRQRIALQLQYYVDEYQTRLSKWLQKVSKYEETLEEREKADLAAAVSALRGWPSATNERSSRNSAKTALTARSDYEADQIVKMISEREKMKSRYEQSAIKRIPAMILEPAHLELCNYSDRNRLATTDRQLAMCDGYNLRSPCPPGCNCLRVVERNRKLANPWTDVEKLVFLHKFLLYPKDFRLIATSLSNKSTQDCIAFYYRSKKLLDFKAMLRDHHASKRGDKALRKRFCWVSDAAAAALGVNLPFHFLSEVSAVPDLSSVFDDNTHSRGVLRPARHYPRGSKRGRSSSGSGTFRRGGGSEFDDDVTCARGGKGGRGGRGRGRGLVGGKRVVHREVGCVESEEGAEEDWEQGRRGELGLSDRTPGDRGGKNGRRGSASTGTKLRRGSVSVAGANSGNRRRRAEEKGGEHRKRRSGVVSGGDYDGDTGGAGVKLVRDTVSINLFGVPVGGKTATGREKRVVQKWTEDEKRDFLVHFRLCSHGAGGGDVPQLYGKDWNKLKEKIPTKSASQIKNYYQNYKNRLGLTTTADGRRGSTGSAGASTGLGDVLTRGSRAAAAMTPAGDGGAFGQQTRGGGTPAQSAVGVSATSPATSPSAAPAPALPSSVGVVGHQSSPGLVGVGAGGNSRTSPPGGGGTGSGGSDCSGGLSANAGGAAVAAAAAAGGMTGLPSAPASAATASPFVNPAVRNLLSGGGLSPGVLQNLLRGAAGVEGLMGLGAMGLGADVQHHFRTATSGGNGGGAVNGGGQGQPGAGGAGGRNGVGVFGAFGHYPGGPQPPDQSTMLRALSQILALQQQPANPTLNQNQSEDFMGTLNNALSTVLNFSELGGAGGGAIRDYLQLQQQRNLQQNIQQQQHQLQLLQMAMPFQVQQQQIMHFMHLQAHQQQRQQQQAQAHAAQNQAAALAALKREASASAVSGHSASSASSLSTSPTPRSTTGVIGAPTSPLLMEERGSPPADGGQPLFLTTTTAPLAGTSPSGGGGGRASPTSGGTGPGEERQLPVLPPVNMLHARWQGVGGGMGGLPPPAFLFSGGQPQSSTPAAGTQGGGAGVKSAPALSALNSSSLTPGAAEATTGGESGRMREGVEDTDKKKKRKKAKKRKRSVETPGMASGAGVEFDSEAFSLPAGPVVIPEGGEVPQKKAKVVGVEVSSTVTAPAMPAPVVAMGGELGATGGDGVINSMVVVGDGWLDESSIGGGDVAVSSLTSAVPAVVASSVPRAAPSSLLTTGSETATAWTTSTTACASAPTIPATALVPSRAAAAVLSTETPGPSGAGASVYSVVAPVPVDTGGTSPGMLPVTPASISPLLTDGTATVPAATVTAMEVSARTSVDPGPTSSVCFFTNQLVSSPPPSETLPPSTSSLTSSQALPLEEGGGEVAEQGMGMVELLMDAEAPLAVHSNPLDGVVPNTPWSLLAPTGFVDATAFLGESVGAVSGVATSATATVVGAPAHAAPGNATTNPLISAVSVVTVTAPTPPSDDPA